MGIYLYKSLSNLTIKFGKEFLRVRLLETGTFPAARTLLQKESGIYSATGQQIGQPWTGHTNYIRSLSLSPNGLILASASRDKTVRLWNATTGDPIGHLQYDVEDANDVGLCKVCFAPNGECVASGGSSGKIYLWRLPWLDSVESQVIPLVMHVTQGGYSSLSHFNRPLFKLLPSTLREVLCRVRNHPCSYFHHTFPILSK